jgi:hypothetical protein
MPDREKTDEQRRMKATAPIDLLRELRRGFKMEAIHFRNEEKKPFANVRAMGTKAYGAEQAVKRIDATLRDWG